MNNGVKKELFGGSSIIRRFTYKMSVLRDNCVFLAKLCHIIMDDFAMGRGYYAIFSKYTDSFCLSPDIFDA